MSASAVRRPPLWRELGVVAFLLVAYDQVANLAALRVHGAEARAEAILRLENGLDIAVEHSLDHYAAGHHTLEQGLALYYDLAHILVTMAVFAAAYIFAPAAYRRLRTTLLVINLAALSMFLLLPVAPPRLVPGGGYVDIVAESHTPGAWETTTTVAQHANEYASMPSLHVAWAVWVLLATMAMTSRRLWRGLAAAHVAATVVVIVVTGNHWLLDAVAGAALALAAHQVVVAARDVRRGWRQLPSEPAIGPLPEAMASAGLPDQ